MPQTEVYFYQESEAEIPVWDWLRDLSRSDRKAAAACIARIRLLAMLGHELRRPNADYLRDGIHELRVKRGRMNYRVLYFFHGQNVALLAHALTKERAVPGREIDRAVERKRRYEKSPFKQRATFVVPEAPDDL
jgi:phage-related protein